VTRRDPGGQTESVVFEAEGNVPDGFGGFTIDWLERHRCFARLTYHRGGEEVEAARLQGRSVYKVRIRSCDAARAITPEYRMRDARRGTIYNIREIDAISDRAWIYIVAESGVAT
jgi:head-tail adaptor